MDERYISLSQVPSDATKPISFGKLKGKSDINPQWRYEALTKEFGLCGIGWKYEVTGSKTVEVPATGELMVFVFINLYVANDDEWSDPIPGSGGDFLIQKDKNGLHGNDEGFKMAITDALGTAAKMVGVAASVYRGLYGTKYAKQEERYQQDQQVQHPTQAEANELECLCQKCGKSVKNMLAAYGVTAITDMDMFTYQKTKNTLLHHIQKQQEMAVNGEEE